MAARIFLMNTLAHSDSKLSKSLISALQVIGASLLLALFAQVKIPLGFTPVPLSGQTFGVMFLSVLLGPRKGPLAVLLYLIEGALGLPVFAGGASGLMTLFGPTGGYLVGFLAQSFLIGRLIRYSRINLFLLLLATSFVQLGMGVLWLGQFVGFNQALSLGVYPFLAGDLLKILAVSSYFRFHEKKKAS